MILKIKPSAAHLPVTQRAKLLATKGNQVIVKLCGTGDVLVVHCIDVCGLELTRQLSINFDVVGSEQRSITFYRHWVRNIKRMK